MAMTGSQRQAKFRALRPFAGNDGNGERRINTWVSTGAALALKRLARRYGVTKREMIEQLINQEDDKISRSLYDDDAAWNAYHGITE
jgi:hypothetical protein